MFNPEINTLMCKSHFWQAIQPKIYNKELVPKYDPEHQIPHRLKEHSNIRNFFQSLHENKVRDTFESDEFFGISHQKNVQKPYDLAQRYFTAINESSTLGCISNGIQSRCGNIILGEQIQYFNPKSQKGFSPKIKTKSLLDEIALIKSHDYQIMRWKLTEDELTDQEIEDLR